MYGCVRVRCGLCSGGRDVPLQEAAEEHYSGHGKVTGVRGSHKVNDVLYEELLVLLHLLLHGELLLEELDLFLLRHQPFLQVLRDGESRRMGMRMRVRVGLGAKE